MKNVYVIEGKNIIDLDSLFKEFARVVDAPNGYFGRCLQSFDDCLFGGFGLKAPCRIIWRNSDFSKQYLDSNMLKKYYQNKLTENDFFTNEGREYVIETIESAEKGEKSMFDEVISFIESITERSIFDDNWIVDLVLK
ncbi:barstar family protein [Romboutsia sp.]|uniref:barstar family protein n=1 Tax=Romboutsia sp. TaxID=1965302 RepID=UPI002B87B195|nr:barstar family protein [Romboutsia sp.]HSQ88581.1 barstar family protein [Romboutsia sp.]